MFFSSPAKSKPKVPCSLCGKRAVENTAHVPWLSGVPLCKTCTKKYRQHTDRLFRVWEVRELLMRVYHLSQIQDLSIISCVAGAVVILAGIQHGEPKLGINFLAIGTAAVLVGITVLIEATFQKKVSARILDSIILYVDSF